MPMPRTGNEAAHWAGGLNNAAAYIANRPAMLAAARQRAAQMQMNQQRGQQYQAQAALLAQKFSDLKVSADDRDALGKAAQDAAPFIQAGKMDSPEVYKFSALIAKVTAANKGHPAAEMLTSLGLPQPNTKYTADTRAKATTDAATTRAGATKYGADKRAATELARVGVTPFSAVPAGGGVIDRRTGQIVAVNPSAAGAKESGYDTVSEEIPAESGTPGTPGEPAKSYLWGLIKKDAVAATPGTPGHPKMHVTRRVPRGAPVVAGVPVSTAAENGDDGGETANPSLAASLANTGVNVRASAATPTVPTADQPAPTPDQTAALKSGNGPLNEESAAELATRDAKVSGLPSKVRVIHPNGTPGFIPAHQLDAALKQGFKVEAPSAD